MDSSTHDSLLINSTASTTTVTFQYRLLAACPCLNIKLHLATEPEKDASLSGKEVKLGLAGVSVEQKILCSLAISKDAASVRCINCDEDVYTFLPSSNSVTIEATSLAFLADSVLFSPSSGIVVPSAIVITDQELAERVNHPHYSKAFRLILTPSMSTYSTSTLTTSTTSFTLDPSSAANTATTGATSTLYRPHLEKVRGILEKELEINLNAQQTRTEARIEAYKSQQLLALQQSIECTKREKERLWIKIQERVSSPPPALTLNLDGRTNPDDTADMNGAQHPFDGSSTLPIRLTSASHVVGAYGAFLDRRRGSVSDMAMSLQFREFDQRLASNSLRRQSLVPPTVTGTNELTLANTAANAAVDRSLLSTSHNSETSNASANAASPTQKSKKKVTIADAVKSVSILEPEQDETYEHSDSEEVEEEEGVVFDLDEELGFDEENPAQNAENDSDITSQDGDSEDQGQSSTNGNIVAINISSSGRSLPKQEGMAVGSLRANYLRRQRGLEQHRQSLNDSSMDFTSGEDEDDYDDGFNTKAPPAFFGTSLPIQIQVRPAMPQPPPPVRTSAVASSLALPPGSSPAAAMLQRRLSRAYGTEGLPETNLISSTTTSRPALAGAFIDGAVPSLVQPILGATPGTLIVDPLMLLEEEHDNDDREDRLRKHRQPFSSINHRRDLLEKGQQEQHEGQGAQVSRSFRSSSITQQADFEPPHLYSARTYVGATPWEMPTRVTVKSGGMREGSHLDKQIALEMAKELEKEMQEMMVDEVVTHSTTMGVNVSHRVVDKIDETEEEEDQEDRDEAQKREQQLHQSSTLPAQRPHSTTLAAASISDAKNDTEER
ncbi:hypothetical protein BGX28_005403 [Mortierella sp. GBA30]|nr:hypothetical protein BGX28_005403 [Mortierella sp. GBA30]